MWLSNLLPSFIHLIYTLPLALYVKHSLSGNVAVIGLRESLPSLAIIATMPDSVTISGMLSASLQH